VTGRRNKKRLKISAETTVPPTTGSEPAGWDDDVAASARAQAEGTSESTATLRRAAKAAGRIGLGGTLVFDSARRSGSESGIGIGIRTGGALDSRDEVEDLGIDRADREDGLVGDDTFLGEVGGGRGFGIGMGAGGWGQRGGGRGSAVGRARKHRRTATVSVRERPEAVFDGVRGGAASVFRSRSGASSTQR